MSGFVKTLSGHLITETNPDKSSICLWFVSVMLQARSAFVYGLSEFVMSPNEKHKVFAKPLVFIETIIQKSIKRLSLLFIVFV